MRLHPLGGLTIKAALLLGFGLTLALWLLAGYDFMRRMSQVEREAAAINSRYTQAQELLSNVRPRVLLASVYVRDALLDPDPRSAGDYRRRLQRTLESVDSALHQYVPVLHSAEERERVERLRQEIEQFGTAMLEVLATDERRPLNEARTLLGRLAPRRDLVISVSEKVQALNRAAFIEQQATIAETYRVNQRRVWTRLGLSLAASLGIAVLAIFYVTRLEKRLQAQRLRDVQHARDLQRLSAQVLHAQEEERRTIARDLHDEVGQALMAVKVELALAQRRIKAGGSADELDDVQTLSDGVLNTVRDLSHLLHPPVLDDLGLPAAIDWHLQGFGRRHGVRVAFHHDMANRRLTRAVETAAYRVIQEALTNVAKHAAATSCRVSMTWIDDELRMTVEDDGKGFDVVERERAGLGLIGVRERVNQLSGRLVIETALGKGTSLRVTFPAASRSPIAPECETEAAALAPSTATVEVPG
jgi:signal transduction histidine kinase